MVSSICWSLIWVPAAARVDPEQFGLRADFPVVILDRSGCTSAIPFVATQNREAARDLAQRTYELGHRHVAVINEPGSDRSMRERWQGIHDVFGDNIALKITANEPEDARSATIELLQESRRPSMLIALSEPLAIGALAGMRDLQLKIPDDLSFAAFDDFPLAGQWSPPLTVIRQDIAALAAATAGLLAKRIGSPRVSGSSPVRIAASIEWRGSVIACPTPSELR